MTLPVRIDRLGEIDPGRGRKVYPPADPDAVQAAWGTEMGRAYRQFSQYPLEAVEPQPEGSRVILSDARFVRGGRAGFACVIELDDAGRVVSEKFGF